MQAQLLRYTHKIKDMTMDKLDFSNFNFDLSSTLNSMQQITAQFDAQREAQYAAIDQMNREKARRDAKMVAGAEASVAQKGLLEEQLKEIKEQNSQLKDNYRLLNELYESAKRDAVESAKEARHNKIFGWVSFGIGTLIGIAGIVFGIIF